jgi:probable rRNA maturation factor
VSPSEPRIHIDEETYPDAPVRLVESAVRHTLATGGAGDAEISVALLPDEDMRRLNHEYLGRDRTTDVIAFSLSGGDDTIVGDVYVGCEQAERQAEEMDVPLTEELVRLVIHGTLHVLGHDHPEGPERVDSPMFRLQEELVRQVLEDSKTL